jgi:hypothetical protein
LSPLGESIRGAIPEGMAAAVEVREPLLPLSTQNLQDLERLSSGLGKMSQPKLRKSASIAAPKVGGLTKADLVGLSTLVEDFVTRESLKPRTFPSFIAGNSKSFKMSHLEHSATLRGSDGEGEAESSGNEEESTSLLQMKMEAMTWAAMAKDYKIASLERRLRQALEIAKAEQERNQELGRLLRESQERELAAALDLEDARRQIGDLVEAEERLCVQLGDLEAEVVEEDRRYRSQIASLTSRIQAQEHYIAEVLASSGAGQEPAASQADSVSYAIAGQCQAVAKNLEKAEEEITALRAELKESSMEFQAAEDARKKQARKLKALERERWYLRRKGAVRSLRLAPHPSRKGEAGTAGGEGWKVSSVLDFEGKKMT